MTESELVGHRLLLKKHFIRDIEDKRQKTPDLTFEQWLETHYWDVIEDRIMMGGRPGLDMDDFIWCWRKATRDRGTL